MNVQKVIEVLIEQRNAALNELALCKADLALCKSELFEKYAPQNQTADGIEGQTNDT